VKTLPNRPRVLASPLRCGLLFLTAALPWTAGCSTRGYEIVLVDGRQFISAEEPELNPKTGYYKFRDRYGRDVLMRKEEVRTIRGGDAGH
jgi:hypothetical protein